MKKNLQKNLQEKTKRSNIAPSNNTTMNNSANTPVLASFMNGLCTIKIRKHPVLDCYCVSKLDDKDRLLMFRQFETVLDAIDFGKQIFGN